MSVRIAPAYRSQAAGVCAHTQCVEPWTRRETMSVRTTMRNRGSCALMCLARRALACVCRAVCVSLSVCDVFRRFLSFVTAPSGNPSVNRYCTCTCTTCTCTTCTCHMYTHHPSPLSISCTDSTINSTPPPRLAVVVRAEWCSQAAARKHRASTPASTPPTEFACACW